MRRSEWIAAGYFVYLLLPIWLNTFSRRRRELCLRTLLLAGLVVVVSRLPDTDVGSAVRNWAPGVYLLAGYWLPGRLFNAPDERLESWLMATDRAWLGEAVATAAIRLPPLLRNYLELTYLFCYPLVPIAFGLLYFSTRSDPVVATDATDDFWTAVLLAVFACYGLLPWLPSRPPRALLPLEGRGSYLRRLNVAVLKNASIQVNTFPSGHVAAALAAALAVGQYLPEAGALIGFVALSIAVAAVLGRYHYAADAVLGAFTALAAFAISRWA